MSRNAGRASKRLPPQALARAQKFNAGEIDRAIRPQPRRRARRRNAGGMPNSTDGKLSLGATEYAMALENPWGMTSACVPSEFPPLPSRKAKLWSRGSGAIGTINGFCMVNAHQFVANDTQSVFFSNGAAYVQDGFNVGAGVSAANSNSPYTNALFGATAGAVGVRYRIVACGLRIWYTGTELNVSGSSIPFRNPDNQSIVTNSLAQVLSFQTTIRLPNTDRRHKTSVVWIPTNPIDTEYAANPQVDGLFEMGVAITGVVDTTFDWEVAMLVEYIGANVTGKTYSCADPEGFSAVLTAAQGHSTHLNGHHNPAEGMLWRAAKAVVSTMSGPVSRFANAMLPRAVNYLGSRAMEVMTGAQSPGQQFLEYRQGVTVEEVNDQVPTQPTPGGRYGQNYVVTPPIKPYAYAKVVSSGPGARIIVVYDGTGYRKWTLNTSLEEAETGYENTPVAVKTENEAIDAYPFKGRTLTWREIEAAEEAIGKPRPSKTGL